MRLVTTFCVTITLVCAAVGREIVRLEEVDIAKLQQTHIAAGEIEGFSIFLVFALLNTIAIAICIWLVRSGLLKNASTGD